MESGPVHYSESISLNGTQGEVGFAKLSKSQNSTVTKLDASKRAGVENEIRRNSARTAFPSGKLFSSISSLSGRPDISPEDVDVEFASARNISRDENKVVVSGIISGVPVERHFVRDGENSYSPDGKNQPPARPSPPLLQR